LAGNAPAIILKDLLVELPEIDCHERKAVLNNLTIRASDAQHVVQAIRHTAALLTRNY